MIDADADLRDVAGVERARRCSCRQTIASSRDLSRQAGASALRPPSPPAALRVVALGGINEIGRNMTMFEYRPPTGRSRLLVVDCGMLLGKTNSPGVDVTLPDWSYFRDRLDDIDAVVLTHGHEDHIGALPYLLRERARHPVYRLPADAGPGRVQARPAPDQARAAAGARGRAAHASARGSSSSSRSTTRSRTRWRSRIRVGGHTVLHTGDFKMDQTPLDGRLTDLPGFSRLGDEGVDLLLADSTNAEVPGFIPSERDVGRVVADVIAKATGRVIVACFASHVHRVQQVLDAAVESGRSGRARRALDGAQHEHRPRPRPAARPRRPAGRPARWPSELPVAARAADLDRVAGRTAVGAVAHGQPRAPDASGSPPTTRSCSRPR